MCSLWNSQPISISILCAAFLFLILPLRLSSKLPFLSPLQKIVRPLFPSFGRVLPPAQPKAACSDGVSRDLQKCGKVRIFSISH